MPRTKKPTPPPAPPAPDVLSLVTLRQQGKPVQGPPVCDNYAVSLRKGIADAPPWHEILDALRAAYPSCVFTYVVN